MPKHQWRLFRSTRLPGHSTFVIRASFVIRYSTFVILPAAAQLADQAGEALSLDELHGIVMHAALAANGVHRDDVLVPQVCGCERLVLEALQLPGVDGRRER